MPDIVDRAIRSRMMAGIRSVNTKPELIIRKGLHQLGYRYRLHSKEVPGKPDIVLPAWKAVVFIHGCFWHGHNCRFFKLPQTRTEFWSLKIESNRKRDGIVAETLGKAGWRQLTIWECAVRGKKSVEIDKVIKIADRWIRSKKETLTIRG